MRFIVVSVFLAISAAAPPRGYFKLHHRLNADKKLDISTPETEKKTEATETPKKEVKDETRETSNKSEYRAYTEDQSVSVVSSTVAYAETKQNRPVTIGSPQVNIGPPQFNIGGSYLQPSQTFGQPVGQVQSYVPPPLHAQSTVGTPVQTYTQNSIQMKPVQVQAKPTQQNVYLQPSRPYTFKVEDEENAKNVYTVNVFVNFPDESGFVGRDGDFGKVAPSVSNKCPIGLERVNGICAEKKKM